MIKVKISAHVMVKNEARFVWYSVMSVVNYVDRIRIWDTGSTDGTYEILKSLKADYSGKTEIILKKVEEKKFEESKIREEMLAECRYENVANTAVLNPFAIMRQGMLKETVYNWIVMVDGDEIWWEDSIAKVTDTIRQRGSEIESIVVPTINLVGDAYHYQEQKAGKYNFFGKMGHYNLRAFSRNIPGLHSSAKPHGIWGWEDEDCKMIQDRDPKKIVYIDAPYLHATHLQRAGTKIHERGVYKRAQKYKHEIGIPFAKDFFYPEVFFEPNPPMVSSVWKPMSLTYKVQAYFETPLRKINRRILKGGVGY